jgi:hypothetical protein
MILEFIDEILGIQSKRKIKTVRKISALKIYCLTKDVSTLRTKTLAPLPKNIHEKLSLISHRYKLSSWQMQYEAQHLVDVLELSADEAFQYYLRFTSQRIIENQSFEAALLKLQKVNAQTKRGSL